MSAEPKEMMVGERSEVTGELTLYKGPSGITIPMMFGVGVFNTFYWSLALADHYIIKADFRSHLCTKTYVYARTL